MRKARTAFSSSVCCIQYQYIKNISDLLLSVLFCCSLKLQFLINLHSVSHNYKGREKGERHVCNNTPAKKACSSSAWPPSSVLTSLSPRLSSYFPACLAPAVKPPSAVATWSKWQKSAEAAFLQEQRRVFISPAFIKAGFPFGVCCYSLVNLSLVLIETQCGTLPFLWICTIGHIFLNE